MIATQVGLVQSIGWYTNLGLALQAWWVSFESKDSVKIKKGIFKHEGKIEVLWAVLEQECQEEISECTYCTLYSVQYINDYRK